MRGIAYLISMRILCAFGVFGGLAAAQSLNCDLTEYHARDGLHAAMVQGELEVAWAGDHGQELRARFTLRDAHPLVRQLAVRGAGGGWKVLARDLTPEFEVVSGRRRISDQQLAPLRALGIALTPELIDREKWNAFWEDRKSTRLNSSHSQ